MANSVTVPGASVSIVLSTGTGDTLNIAQMIGAALNSLGGSLAVAPQFPRAGQFRGQRRVPGATVNELLLTSGGNNATIPSGYEVVVVTGGGNTLTGANVEILGGTVGGTYSVIGDGTIAATGEQSACCQFDGRREVRNFTGPGNNTIVASGTGVIADGPGSAWYSPGAPRPSRRWARTRWSREPVLRRWRRAARTA